MMSNIAVDNEIAAAQNYCSRLPQWAAQEVSTNVKRFAFIMAVLECHRPTTMAEIGVSAGTLSGALLSKALTYTTNPVLYGIDFGKTTYFNGERRIGDMLLSTFPDLTPHHRLYTEKTALDADEIITEQLDFLYIDANHCHPWASIDCLCMVPHLKRGALIGFHDTAISHTQARSGVYAFHSLTLDKFENTHEDPHGSGFCIYDGDRERMLESLLESFTLPWDYNTGQAPDAPVAEEFIARLLDLIDKHYGPMLRTRLERRILFSMRLGPVCKALEKAFAQKQLNDIHSSTSWKITTPVRWIKNFLTDIQNNMQNGQK